jgi:hypothetical protein
MSWDNLRRKTGTQYLPSGRLRDPFCTCASHTRLRGNVRDACLDTVDDKRTASLRGTEF